MPEATEDGKILCPSCNREILSKTREKSDRKEDAQPKTGKSGQVQKQERFYGCILVLILGGGFILSLVAGCENPTTGYIIIAITIVASIVFIVSALCPNKKELGKALALSFALFFLLSGHSSE